MKGCVNERLGDSMVGDQVNERWVESKRLVKVKYDLE